MGQIDRFNGLTGGVAVKIPCRVRSTANLTLSGEQTIDGVAVVSGDRVLVMDQTTTSENGIYNASTGAWSRAPDFDGDRDVVQGTIVVTALGTLYSGYSYKVTTADPITIGTTGISFGSALQGVEASAAAQSAVAAASSAAAAAATLASALWRDVVFKTFADSPVTVAQADNGKLFVVDTAGGNVVFNLPLIASTTMPFTVGVKKETSDVNTVTANRAGTDTIDGATSKVYAAQGGGQFVADVSPSPDVWTEIGFGPTTVEPSMSTGDVKITLKTVADTGWVMMDDKTIGNAASGATGRANADTAALFALLWTNISDTYCAVSGGRGVSAAADYAANKTIALPKTLGRALGISGAGSGLTARALGEVLGTETHTLSTNEIPAHNHPVTDPGHAHTSNLATSSPGGGGYNRAQSYVADAAAPTVNSNTTGITVGNNTTTSSAHNNMQPTSFMNAMVKL